MPFGHYESASIDLTDVDRKRAREVFALVIAEMDDANRTGDMFREFGTLVHYVCRNRKITRLLNEMAMAEAEEN